MFSEVETREREAEGGDLPADRVDVRVDDALGPVVAEALRDDLEVREEIVDLVVAPGRTSPTRRSRSRMSLSFWR